MKQFIDKLIERLEKEMLQSAEAKAEAIIGMCGASANAYCGEVDAYEKAIKIVKDLAEEHNNEWIPCEERLPDTENDYIICFKNGYIAIATFEQGEFWDYSNAIEPIAWQPLPAPYKKGE